MEKQWQTTNNSPWDYFRTKTDEQTQFSKPEHFIFDVATSRSDQIIEKSPKSTGEWRGLLVLQLFQSSDCRLHCDSRRCAKRQKISLKTVHLQLNEMLQKYTEGCIQITHFLSPNNLDQYYTSSSLSNSQSCYLQNSNQQCEVAP